MQKYYRTFPMMSFLYVMAAIYAARSVEVWQLVIAFLVLWHGAYVALTFMADVLSILIVIAIRVGVDGGDMEMVRNVELDE